MVSTKQSFLQEKVHRASGFTLVELLLVMGIIGILITISSLLLLNLIPKASFTTQSEVLLSQIRQQQLKAMTGYNEGEESGDYYGVFFQEHAYTLFKGQEYDPDSVLNYTTQTDDSFTFTTTFPDNQIVFEPNTGKVLNFIFGQNIIALTNKKDMGSITINFNEYGVESY